ncbi:MAG: hypothetical protein ACREHG_09770, partial [Candidatus Saccharimonadales bacterium]
ASMPTARHGLGSAVVQGRIHVISGGPTPGGSFSDLNEVFTIPSISTRWLSDSYAITSESFRANDS